MVWEAQLESEWNFTLIDIRQTWQVCIVGVSTVHSRNSSLPVNKKHLKMLGPFATASRLSSIYRHSLVGLLSLTTNPIPALGLAADRRLPSSYLSSHTDSICISYLETISSIYLLIYEFARTTGHSGQTHPHSQWVGGYNFNNLYSVCVFSLKATYLLTWHIWQFALWMTALNSCSDVCYNYISTLNKCGLIYQLALGISGRWEQWRRPCSLWSLSTLANFHMILTVKRFRKLGYIW